MKRLIPILAASALLFLAGDRFERPPLDRGLHQGDKASPDGRDAYRRAQRGGIDGRERIDALMHAKQVLDDRRAVLSKDAAAQDGGIGNWTWLGPSNIGGRVRALVRHPTNFDILWAGSAGGGIWKTTNGGSSWSHASDFLPSLAVSSMTIDPNNANVLYASTGEGFGNADALPGVGVFKSTDGGLSFYQI